MRKKIFATLMSVAMIASFMPSIAFAAECNFALASTTTWDEVQKQLNSDNAKYISEVKAPSHGKNGSAVVKCKEEFCDNTQNVTITAPCNDTDASAVAMWKDEYVARALDQKIFKTQAAADQWLKNNSDKCRVSVNVCAKCGKITGDPSLTDHQPKDGTDPEDCQSYVCKNCGKTVKATEAHTLPAAPADSEALANLKKVSEPTCGHGSGYEVKCTECGEKTVWYFDEDLADGTASDMKTDAHNYGATVASSKATKKAKGGYEVLPGYVAYVEEDLYYLPGETISKDDLNDVEFYALNTVVEAGTNCSDTMYGLECTVCHHKAECDGEVIKGAGAHNYEETAVAATCDHGSYVKKVCKVCGYETATAEKDDKLAHSYTVTKTDATCTSGEKYTIVCATCDKKDTTVCSHNAGKVEITSAEGLPVYKDGKDSVIVHWDGFDNELKGKDLIELTFTKNPSVAHKYGETELLKPATCTNDEVWGKKCTECGKVNHALVTVKYGTKLGHKFKESEVKATCGTEGYKVAQCENCGEYKTATGTTKKADEALKMNVVKPVVAPGAKCTFDKVLVLRDSTVFEEGVKTFVCSKCGAEDSAKATIAKKTVKKPVVTVKTGKKAFTVKASAANATGYKVVYKRAGKKAITKVVNADKLSKTYKKLAKGKKYTVKVTAFASNGTETVYGATTTKTVKTK